MRRLPSLLFLALALCSAVVLAQNASAPPPSFFGLSQETLGIVRWAILLSGFVFSAFLIALGSSIAARTLYVLSVLFRLAITMAFGYFVMPSDATSLFAFPLIVVLYAGMFLLDFIGILACIIQREPFGTGLGAFVILASDVLAFAAIQVSLGAEHVLPFL